jgi:hypothetical protein
MLLDTPKTAWIIVVVVLVVLAFVVTIYVGRGLFGRKRRD